MLGKKQRSCRSRTINFTLSLNATALFDATALFNEIVMCFQTWKTTKNYTQQEEINLNVKDNFFYIENNQSVEQPPQGHGGDPITEGFQDTTGQGDG